MHEPAHLKEGGSRNAKNQEAEFGSNEAAKEMVEYGGKFSFSGRTTPTDSSKNKKSESYLKLKTEMGHVGSSGELVFCGEYLHGRKRA